MEHKDIMDRIKSRKFYLNKIVAQKIDNKPEQKTIDISQETEYEILENRDERLSIKFSTRTFIEPDVLFSIETEHIVDFVLKSIINENEIKENINTLISPLSNEVSYVIATITKEMINSRIILPPALAAIKKK